MHFSGLVLWDTTRQAFGRSSMILLHLCLHLRKWAWRKINKHSSNPHLGEDIDSINANAFEVGDLLQFDRISYFNKIGHVILQQLAHSKQSIFEKTFIVFRSNCSSSTLGFLSLSSKSSFRICSANWFWFFGLRNYDISIPTLNLRSERFQSAEFWIFSLPYKVCPRCELP